MLISALDSNPTFRPQKLLIFYFFFQLLARWPSGKFVFFKLSPLEWNAISLHFIHAALHDALSPLPYNTFALYLFPLSHGGWLLYPNVISTCLTYSSHLHGDVLLSLALWVPPNFWLRDATMPLSGNFMCIYMPILRCAYHIGHLGRILACHIEIFRCVCFCPYSTVAGHNGGRRLC